MDFSKKYDISVYLTEEQLNKRIAEIGAQITEKYKGQSVYLICILKGSIFFTTELAKRIALPMTMDFMSVSSYGSGTESSGDVKIKKDLEHSIEGENVIIIEISLIREILLAGFQSSLPKETRRASQSAHSWTSLSAV